MLEGIDRVLISEGEIRGKVRELGGRITRDYEGECPLLIGVLKGASLFIADLVRTISLPLQLDFISISSYGPDTQSSGVVRILKDLDESITGRHVIIVEGIVDTGLTVSYLVRNLSAREPKSLKICTLLDKPARRIVEVKIDYKGFEIPDYFVVGYGLDYNQRYRNLPFIATLKM